MGEQVSDRPKPPVTIVIPTYTDFDKEKESPKVRMERCVRSIINQSYERVEILVCDDGTPLYYEKDLIASEVNRLKEELDDTKMTITHLKFPHKGQADVLNEGFAAAKGDYVMDLNDDDIILHDFLDAAVDFMEQPGSKHIGYVYSDYLYTNNWREFGVAQPRPEPWNKETLRQKQIAPVIGLIRSKFAKTVKWDTELDHSEDWDYLLRLSKVTEAFYMKDTYSFVVFLSKNQKSMEDAVGVAKSEDVIRKRIEAGYYG